MLPCFYSDIPDVQVSHVSVEWKCILAKQLTDASFKQPLLKVERPQSVLSLSVSYPIHQRIAIVSDNVWNSHGVSVDAKSPLEVAAFQLREVVF